MTILDKLNALNLDPSQLSSIKNILDEALEEATAKGKLLDDGLPPLGQLTGNSSFKTQPSYGIHSPRGKDILTIQKDFGKLEDCRKSQLKRVESYMWMKSNKGENKYWENEASIQVRVTEVLQEVINCCDLTDSLHLVPEKTFSFNQKDLKSLRADIALIRNQYGSVVGVCKVKKPTAGSTRNIDGGDLLNDILMIQISNYMLELRYTWGVEFVFGIISTYNHWRIVWLKDSDEIAQATIMQNLTNAKIIEDSHEEKQVIYASKILTFNDKSIVEYLASVVKKMHLSPIHPPTGLQLDQRKFA